MEIINEGSSAKLRVAFKDYAGNLAAPNAATYEIYDVVSNQALVLATQIEPLGPQVEISLPVIASAIQDATRPYEKRRVIVRAIFGAGEALNETFDYKVRNLIGIG
jgi:hypothetical protein